MQSLGGCLLKTVLASKEAVSRPAWFLVNYSKRAQKVIRLAVRK